MIDHSTDAVCHYPNGSQEKVRCIISEYAPEGSLFERVVENSVSHEMSKTITRKVLQTINFLEEMGFAHRDIKSENLVIDSR